MPTNNRKNRDLSRLGLVGHAEAGNAWQSLVTAAEQPGERLEGARELPLNLIVANAAQPRKHFDGERLESLAASIREDGVIQPIVVRPHPTQAGKYLIVAGERRYRAAGRAGLTAIPAIITDDDAPATARKMLRENIEREDLDLEDLGQYLLMLQEAGATQRELAALTHFSLGRVNGLLRLVKRPDLIEKIRAGLLTQQQAVDLLAAERQGLDTPRRAASAADAALSEYRPLARLATWAQTFKPQRVPPEQRPAVRAHLLETIDRLMTLYEVLGEGSDETDDPAAPPTRERGARRQ